MRTILTILIIILLMTWQPLSSRAAVTITVDRRQVVQPDFKGFNAVYHAFCYMPEAEEEGMDNTSRAVEFQRLSSSGLEIARTFYRPNWAMGDWYWSRPDWQSTRMQALYKWLAAMQRRHITVGLNMGWWFSRDVIWHHDQHLPAYPGDINHYAAWVSESLRQIIQTRGFSNVKYIFMFTEPGAQMGSLPGGRRPWPYYAEVLKAVDKRLRADGRRRLIKIVGPDTSHGRGWLQRAALKLNKVIDIYAAHSYHPRNYAQWLKLAREIKAETAATGKPFWIDEYGLPNLRLRRKALYGNLLAQANAAFLNAGAQSTFLWMFNDQYYPYPLQYFSNKDDFSDGLHKWGLFPWLPRNRTVRPAWYVYTMLGRLLGGLNREVYKTEGGPELYAAATGRAHKLSVLLVNGSARRIDFRLKIRGWAGSGLYSYLYDPQALSGKRPGDKIIPRHWSLVGAGGVLTAIIPARGVIVYSTKRRNLSGPPLLSNGADINLSSGRQIKASSSVSAHPAANLIDGRRLSYWQAADNDRRPWFIVDLGKVYWLRRAEVCPRVDRRDKIGAGFPASYILTTSLNGNTWRKAAADTDIHHPSAAIHGLSFTSRQARYVRFSGIRAAHATAMEIGELRLYGAELKNKK
ncbi:MAG TPA: discoidin domain-containing protein [Desulfobacterales bacterium]|nr:discoidin domain-containing protein [Desulfobacterales bacterium]